MRNPKTVITCAVTGGGNTVQKSDKVPVTPKQIAAACLEANKAGAAVVHIHVRDPKTGLASRDPQLYREVVERVRDSGTNVVLNLTTGMGADWAPSEANPSVGTADSDMVGPMERMVHVDQLRPEICSLDVGSMNFGDMVFVNIVGHVKKMAAQIAAWGVKPELEVFDLGHARFAAQLVAEGLISVPPLCQVCLGVPWGAAADTLSMFAMVQALPKGAVWSGFGLGRAQAPMVAQVYLLGGHVRVGLEDNLYLGAGRLATNGKLVERAVNTLQSIGADIATPDEARAIFGLVSRGNT
jgi:uncharacterized protein (DUF849 family)